MRFPVIFGNQGIKYTVRDLFTTPLVAGSINGTNSEPGPGTRIIVDTENKISVETTGLVFAGGKAVSSNADPYIRLSQGAARTTYPCLFMRFIHRETTATAYTLGYRTATSAAKPDVGFESYSSGGMFITGNYRCIDYLRSGTEYEIMIQAMSTGYLYFIRGGLFIDWTYCGYNPVGTTATLYAAAQSFNRMYDIREIAIIPGRGVLAADWPFATTHTASPTDGITATMPPNAVIEFTWTVVTGETLTIMFRRVDDDNTWKLVCSQTGSSMRLYKREAGVDTEIVSGFEAQTWVNGTAYRIQLRCLDQRILTYQNLNLRQNTYFNTFNDTATGVKVTGFTTGSNLIITPFYVNVPIKRKYSYAGVQHLGYGDSKTFGEGYQGKLSDALVTATGYNWTHLDPLARSGYMFDSMQPFVDDDLASLSYQKNPAYILINLGSNDATAAVHYSPSSALKVPALYIIDALHAKWPSAKIGLAQVWRNGFAAECDIVDGLIAEVVSERSSFCFLGPDERTFLPANTADGVHPNAAGYTIMADLWKTSMGF